MNGRWFRLGAALVAVGLGAACPDPGTTSDKDTDGVVTDLEGDADADADADTDVPPLSDADSDGSPDDEDCDDDDAAVFPGAPDACGDDKVTDCDRTSDDGLVTIVGGASFTSLQDALDAAADGDAILLCPGEYAGPFATATAVALSSHGGRDVTTLVGGAGSTIALPGDSSLTGLTIRDGFTLQRGGGVQVTSAGTVTVDDCVVTHNRADSGGGISAPPGATLVVTRSEVSGNAATFGGGVQGADATIDLADSTVTMNEASYGGGVYLERGSLSGGIVTVNAGVDMAGYYYEDVSYGGGVYAQDASITGTEISANTALVGAGLFLEDEITLLDVAVRDNVADSLGGGFYLVGDLSLDGTTEVSGNQGLSGGGGYAYQSLIAGGYLHDNVADYYGGGLMVSGGTIDGVTIEANSARIGGGVFVDDSFSVIGATIEANTASVEGGGIAVPYDGGGDTETETDTSGTRWVAGAPVVTGTTGTTFTTVPDTSTDTGSGGGGRGLLTVVETLIVGNTAPAGGGIYTAMALEAENTQVTDNVADEGGGVHITGRRGTLLGGSVLRNVANLEGGGAWLGEGGELASVSADWGTDADDNVPDDVWTGRAAVSGYGAAASFNCRNAGCE